MKIEFTGAKRAAAGVSAYSDYNMALIPAQIQPSAVHTSISSNSNFVSVRDWFDSKLGYIETRYENAGGVLDWNEDTGLVSMLMTAYEYGGYAEFLAGVDGSYIEDGKLYVNEHLLWQAFGLVIDPPLVVNTKKDTAILASAIVLGIKGPSLVKGVASLAKTYLAPLTIGAGTTIQKTLETGVNFANTAFQHMQNPNRFVPVSTLIDAIRYGTPSPDPQGSQAIMYKIEMFRNGTSYTLEVLYDVATNTIFHFKYFK